MNNLIHKLTSGFQSERGQALAEYALILALIALACVIAVAAIGTTLDSKLTGFAGNLV